MAIELNYCPVNREHSEPRWDRQGDAFDPPADMWAPGCGHEACQADDAEKHAVSGWHDYDCPVAQCRWSTIKNPCQLGRDHDGPHEFDPIPAPLAATAGGRGAP